MSNYQTDRDEFFAVLFAEGLPLATISKLLRAATTLNRLAERECNGDDWISKNLVRCPQATKQSTGWCSICSGQSGVHGQVTASTIKIDRTESRVRGLLQPSGIVPVFSGDPRGAVFKLKLKSGKANDFGGEGLYCVPTRIR